MFYGSGDRAGATGVGGAGVAVYVAGTRRGRAVPSAHAGGVAAPSGSRGRDRAGSAAAVSALPTGDAPPGCAVRILAGWFWTSAGAGYALPVRALPPPVPATAGCAGSGAGPHQRFPGPFAGAAGSGGAVSADGASGAVVAGSNGEPDGRLAGGADWDKRQPTTARASASIMPTAGAKTLPAQTLPRRWC